MKAQLRELQIKSHLTLAYHEILMQHPVCVRMYNIKSYTFLKKLALAILFLDCTYLGGTRFEYQPEHRLSWLRFLVMFHSLSRQKLESYLGVGHD
jgi:hypothetical protein